MITKQDWNSQYYHGWNNKYPFTEVVSFVMRNFAAREDRKAIRILDLGCGGGHHLMFLAEEGFDFFGIDGASKALEIAEERLKAKGLNTGTLVCATFEKMPFEDNFFDAVIDRGALVCNRRADLSALLDETRRVLKPGGKLLSMILHDTCSSRAEAEHLGDGDYQNFKGRLSGAGVLHYTNAADAEDLFKAFKIEDLQCQIQKSEYAAANNPTVVSWMIVTCAK